MATYIYLFHISNEVNFTSSGIYTYIVAVYIVTGSNADIAVCESSFFGNHSIMSQRIDSGSIVEVDRFVGISVSRKLCAPGYKNNPFENNDFGYFCNNSRCSQIQSSFSYYFLVLNPRCVHRVHDPSVKIKTWTGLVDPRPFDTRQNETLTKKKKPLA